MTQPNPIDAAVQEFEEKWHDKGDERYGRAKHNNTILGHQIDWLRSTLQRVWDAAQAETHKGENWRKGYQEGFEAGKEAARKELLEKLEKLKKRKKYVKDDGRVELVVQNTRFTQGISAAMTLLDL